MYGGLDWLYRTSGNLTRRELLATYAVGGVAGIGMVADWLRATRSTQRAGLHSIQEAPSSPWVMKATTAAAAQSPLLVNHAYRTFAFGAAFATCDQIDVDLEVLFVACLLHDLGLMEPRGDRCFTYCGAQAAVTAAESVGEHAKGRLAGEAIAQHIWPIARRGRLSPEALLLQWGSAADILGTRIRRFDPSYLNAVREKWPRLDLGVEISERWRIEALMVPRGRTKVLDVGGVLRARMRSWG